MSSPNVRIATDEDFDGLIGNGFALVDFWAPWCGPCRSIAPLLDEVAMAQAGNLDVVKVNVDENPILARRFAVRSIPTLLLFRNGSLVDGIVGAPTRAHLHRWLSAKTDLNTAA